MLRPMATATRLVRVQKTGAVGIRDSPCRAMGILTVF